ncbi:beta-glucosidase BglX [Pelagicoccus sp. SDUM812003]|uniref:beta-glucosidase BglX n=1 Tax=Pelagicoccus sp. SDUM812003 TaxID=3041267 RepID=UPI00280D4A3A|nr:beta-glucosidase BglX [Pelagicoccus sp. SDUM812003]MDQ8204142.1 beta-glucosidase BglX [Pelagicoccus sp. SDUM812003]
MTAIHSLKTTRLLLALLVAGLTQLSLPTAADAAPESRIDELLQKMTLREKIGQLNLSSAGDITTGQATNSVTETRIIDGEIGGLFNISQPDKIREAQRLAVEESAHGIPLLFGMDVIHGYKTVFPIPLALASTWDMQLIEESSRIAAREASAEGICWTFSPMVDISRDPRWGRVAEGVGEDPFLGSRIAEAMVRGYQGQDLSQPHTLLACVKHFALYGASEAGRDYNTTDMSRLKMYNDYLPPYKAAIDAGAGSVMTSFNDIDGIPASANRWLLTDLLRKQWGFDGFVVTDYTTILEMIAHGLGDLETVSSLALKAGVDMDMVSEGFTQTLENAVASGDVTEQQIDQACRRILEAKFELGLFDAPYQYLDRQRAEKEVFSEKHRQTARQIAAQSMVLLKNQNQLLPLEKTGTIAVIGPLADNKANMPGTWSVAANLDRAVSIVEGLRQAVDDQAKILYAKGANIYADPLLESRVSIFGKDTGRDPRSEEELIAEALRIAESADVIVAVLGESAEMSGESASRSDIDLPATQRKLLQALLETGKPVALTLLAGRPLTLEWEDQRVPAILNAWFPGSEAGHAVADVLFGDVNPSGKLPSTWPRNVGQIPVYYNHKSTGRPQPPDSEHVKFRTNYLDVSNRPLYPFGYGLSYTTFEYSDLRLSSDQLGPGDTLTVSVELANTGQRPGAEVVQLYLRDLAASITRPVKELKGFKKISLKPGQRKTVSFTLSEDDLKFYNSQLEHVTEPGEHHVFVGGNSVDLLSAPFELVD